MNIVEKTLKEHWDRLLPIDPMAIAQSMGIRLIPMDNIQINDGELEELGYSGEASIDEKGIRTITYNEGEHINRQRFTVAHEIGHHILGHVTITKPCLRDTPSEYSASINNPIEREANNFAAQLLMPEEAIKILVRKRGITTVTGLATAFGVSEIAMRYRLKNIRLSH